MRLVGRILVYVGVAVAALAAAAAGLVWLESRKAVDDTGEYVALGSSFAAGPKLGSLVPGSPHACWRTADNYPHQLARATGLRLVDVSCGGAKTANLLQGGPFFQPPQVLALGPSARLVTVTIGGNDVDYIGDLGLLAWRESGGALGTLVRTFWKGPRPAGERDLESVVARMVRLVEVARQRSPQAKVVLVTYPRVLPATGTCGALGIPEADADLMREVARMLVAATEAAAERTGARVVDMDAASAGHDACSAEPWVNGATASGDGAMFHPNRAGARATAGAIDAALRNSRN